jgi:hypothetical protein
MSMDVLVGLPYVRRKLALAGGRESVSVDSARAYTKRVGFPCPKYDRAQMNEYGHVQRLWWRRRVDVFIERRGYAPATPEYHAHQVARHREQSAFIAERIRRRALED